MPHLAGKVDRAVVLRCALPQHTRCSALSYSVLEVRATCKEEGGGAAGSDSGSGDGSGGGHFTGPSASASTTLYGSVWTYVEANEAEEVEGGKGAAEFAPGWDTHYDEGSGHYYYSDPRSGASVWEAQEVGAERDEQRAEADAARADPIGLSRDEHEWPLIPHRPVGPAVEQSVGPR